MSKVTGFASHPLLVKVPSLAACFATPDRKGLLHLVFAPTQYPARAARQWIPNGFRRVSRQSCSSVDPAQYPARAARQWVPQPEWLASGSPRVSRQSGLPLDPGQYPARAAGQWILQSGSPVDPAACQSIPPSIPPSIPLTIPE